ncbi:MAG: NYN domain-containing protein [bacterium]|nr:NYN domain-containing protein [bacterium]
MSVIKHKAQRVAVLIDVQNMYHSAKNIYGSRVNFREVLKAAVASRELVKAIGYVIRTESGEEKPFLEALVKVGIETKLKDLQIFPGGAKKGDWDVGLTIDAVRLSETFIDTIVIVSGDGDFVPLVEYLKAKGIQTEIMAFERSASGKLKEVADDYIDLGADLKKYLLKIKKIN